MFPVALHATETLIAATNPFTEKKSCSSVNLCKRERELVEWKLDQDQVLASPRKIFFFEFELELSKKNNFKISSLAPPPKKFFFKIEFQDEVVSEFCDRVAKKNFCWQGGKGHGWRRPVDGWCATCCAAMCRRTGTPARSLRVSNAHMGFVFFLAKMVRWVGCKERPHVFQGFCRILCNRLRLFEEKGIVDSHR